MLNYLLDTCLISEMVKTRPEPAVGEWLDSVPEGCLFLSVLTIGEIEKGAAKMRDPKRKERIRQWLNQELTFRFSGRILPISQEVAHRWGTMTGEAEGKGFRLPVIDSLLAATALVFDMILVTRNTSDVNKSGAKILCPWPSQAKTSKSPGSP